MNNKFQDMGSKEMDKLFREGLDQTFQFDRAEQQWEHISSMLDESPKRKKFWLWWYFGGLLLILGTGLSVRQTFSKPALSAFPASIENHQGKGHISNAKSLKTKGRISTGKPAKTSIKPLNSVVVAAPEVVLPSAPTQAASNIQESSIYTISHQSSPYHHKVGDGTEVEQQRIEQSSAKAKSMQAYSNRTAISELTFLSRQIQPLETPSEILPIVELTSTANTTRNHFTLRAGVLQAFLNDTAIVDNQDARLFFGVGVRLHRNLEWIANYSSTSFSRTTRSEPNAYNIPLVDVPIGFTTPNQTEIRFRQRQIETGLQYQIPSLRWPKVHLRSGIQLAQNRDIQAEYDYQNIYEILSVETDLPAQPLHVSAVFAGLSVEFPILQKLSVTTSYQYYQAVNGKYFRWRNNNQLSAALQYKF